MSPVNHASTRIARAGVDEDRGWGAVMPPLHLSSNFSFAGFGEKRLFDYTRSGNPTRQTLGQILSELEGGAGAVVTSSGMAALDLVFSRARPGDLIVAPHDCYGGSYRLLSERQARGDFRVVFVDQNDAPALDAALSLAPTLVLVETPSNPLLRIVDLGLLARKAHDAGARLAVDNTFLSPALQQPIAWGADFVIHSTTKYINGHSDVVGGAVISASPEDAAKLEAWANCVGVTGAPFDSYLTLRGLRTLFVRLEQQSRTAGAVAAALAAHRAVRRTWYPGLAGHPGHALAAAQQRGFGAMISFELENEEAVRRLVPRLRLFTLAESLGGVETLVAHPATMTHAAMDPAAREAAGVTDGLLRLSIGLEHQADLIADLTQALDTL
ncbi:MAG TPA: cystathionine gamma-synthase [Phenylobacterium sp.]|nr:cystathionine gamma-synthase [Phenylobacterium sp.]